MAFNKHAGEVAAPVATNPSKALAQIFRAVLKGSLNLRLLVVLHADFPIVCVKPPGDEVVVVGVELAGSPLFVSKSIGKIFVLQDAAAISRTASRQAWQATVDVQTGRAVKVSAFEVGGAQEVPDANSLASLKSLRCADTAHLGVFEWCQHPLQHFLGPDDIVVDEDGEFGGDFRDGSAHLPTLVRFPDAQDPQLLRVDLVSDFGQCLSVGIDGDEEHFVGLRLQACPDRPVEFLATGGDGGQDNGDILGGVCWSLRYGYWPVGPV